MATDTAQWQAYLSGEIHTDWREQIESGVASAGLPVSFSAPVTNHGFSDDCGVGNPGIGKQQVLARSQGAHR